MYATLHNTAMVNGCKKLSYDKYVESMFKVYYKTYKIKIIGSVHVISTKLEYRISKATVICF